MTFVDVENAVDERPEHVTDVHYGDGHCGGCIESVSGLSVRLMCTKQEKRRIEGMKVQGRKPSKAISPITYNTLFYTLKRAIEL